MFPAFYYPQNAYMKRLPIPTLLLFTAIFFARCSKCDCVDTDVNFNFAGFTTAEISEVKVKKFSRGSGFSSLVDSTHFKHEIDYQLQQQGDTVYFTSRSGDITISKDADWQIELPAANRIFRITDIDVAQIRDDCSGKVQCGNPVRSMRIDGALLQGPIIIPVGFMLHK